MLEEHEFEDDSGDPEMAFVRLETKFRRRLNQNLASIEDNSGAYSTYYIEYMNHTLAAVDALGLDILPFHSVPSHSSKSHEVWEKFLDFTTAVDHYSVKVKIAHAHGRSAFGVTLSGPEKEKIRHYVAQIKTTIDASNLPPDKKEALFAKINAFLGAVDKDRTSMKDFSDFIISAAGTAGDVAEELEPTWKWVRAIAQLFGVNIGDEQKRIPTRRRPEQIEGPKKRLPPPSKSKGGYSDLDDDIPF